MTGVVEGDEHPWDDFAQAPVPSVGEDGRVESRLDRALLMRRIGIDGDVEERVDWRLIVFDGAPSSGFGINAEVDLAALS